MKTTLDVRNASGISSPGPRRRRLAVALVPLLAAGVAVAIVLGTRSPSSRTAGETSSAASAAVVQRRNLVETDTESGTLSYADPQTVYDRLSGTVTWLPGIGRVIKRGKVLFDVNNEPAILLYGITPAYRDLKSSDSVGPDIDELNTNLIALGYGHHGLIANDSWQTATTHAVEALQQALGERQTGKLSLGEVVFLPAEQLVNSVNATAGLGSSASASGGAGASATAILQTSSTRLVATVDLAPISQSEAVVGMRVTVEMPNGSTVGGTITAVSTVAQSASNSGAGGSSNNSSGSGGSGSTGGGSTGGAQTSATVPVTITLDKRVKGAGLDQAAVSVNFAQVKATNVLSVPVTALVAVSGGGYAVQQAAARHRLIPVTTGLFAAGYVQISGSGIYPGLQVTDSQG
jgi:hypothetical protein